MRGVLLVVLVVLVGICSGINNEILSKEEYLDTLAGEVGRELGEVQDELINSAKNVREATRTYAKTKLTHNLFKALRVLAEKELSEVPIEMRIRQPRQDGGEDEVSGGNEASPDDEDSGSDSGSSGSGSATTTRNVPLIPVLANILKSVFGGDNGTRPLNVTHTLQHASKIIFSPITGPLSGVSNLFRRPTPAPVRSPSVGYYPELSYPPPELEYVPIIRRVKTTEVPPTEKPTTQRPLRLTGRKFRRAVGRSEEEQTMSSGVSKSSSSSLLSKSALYAPSYAPLFQPNSKTYSQSLLNTSSSDLIMPIYAPSHSGQIYAPTHSTPINNNIQNAPPNLTNNTPSKIEPIPTAPPKKSKPLMPQGEVFIPVFAEAPPAAPKTTTNSPIIVSEGPKMSENGPEGSTSSTPTEAPKPGLIYVDSLARDVQTGLDGLVKNLPDILKGAKEAIGLLANIREIFGEEDDG